MAFLSGIMDLRVRLLLLFVLGATWACNARQLATSDMSSKNLVTSDFSVLQVIYQEQEKEVQASEVGRNENVCTLCEEFTAQAVDYLSENKTQTEIIGLLHTSCSKLRSFKQQCITLVDYYAPLFFLEMSTIQPEDFCRKVNLCEKTTTTSPALYEDSCGFCHKAVAEFLVKLEDPDTQLEIIELLLKACDAMENYVKKCKRMVFEYGPLILANAEKFLETTDICTTFHACNSSGVSMQALSMTEVSMLSDS
ncbi:hypothetical protein L1049_008958 [Liquidambar formosana]|uniref:Pulmonary surfactant-associated protein B n=1 Tax=Liquidambar formosana TaxID=63359 RepID=A0AAP0SAH6_LIQFO